MADRDHGMPDAVVQAAGELRPINGELRLGLNINVTDEVFEQYRLGYRCLACHHFPQPRPFPDNCVEDYCRFEMKRRQLELLAFEHRGDADLNEERRRRQQIEDQGLWLPNWN